MKLTKDGTTYDVTDEVQVSAFLKSGYKPMGGSGRIETPEPEQASASDFVTEAIEDNSAAIWTGFDANAPDRAISDYSEMEEGQLAAIAAKRGIDIEGKTRRQVINALRKEAWHGQVGE